MLALVLASAMGVSAQSSSGEPRVGSAPSNQAASEESRKQGQRALANARFVEGDVRGALEALNTIGEPRIDGLKIDGRVRARADVLSGYLGDGNGEILTWGRLARLGRRLEALPIASSGKVRYDLHDGSATVHPILYERHQLYSGPFDWATIAVRGLIGQKFVVPVSDPTGHGEVWTPSFRWSPGHPGVALDVAAPAPGWLPGIVTIDSKWQTQQYPSSLVSSSAGAFRENHSRVGVTLSDWLTGSLRWEGGVGINHIGPDTYGSVNAGVNLRTFGDHMSTSLGGVWYTSDIRSTATGQLVVSLRSTTRDDRFVVFGRGGVALAGDGAPLSLWPTAGSGPDHTAFLRAHPLYESAVVLDDAFGRQLAFASLESVVPLPTRLGPTFLGLAGFVDAARAREGLTGGTSPMQVDIGTGIRVNSSRSGGRVRLDVAYGLHDGKVHVSAGYVQPWGER